MCEHLHAYMLCMYECMHIMYGMYLHTYAHNVFMYVHTYAHNVYSYICTYTYAHNVYNYICTYVCT